MLEQYADTKAIVVFLLWEGADTRLETGQAVRKERRGHAEL